METPILNNIFTSVGNKIPFNDFGHKNKFDEKNLREEVNYLTANRDGLIKLINSSLSGFERDFENISNILGEIEAYMHFHSIASTLNGVILAELLKEVGVLNSELILSGLEQPNSMNYWTIIRSLPTLFAEYQLEPYFAARFFESIGKIIKEDLASGDFFQAIEYYAFNFPSDALKVFLIYKENNFHELQLDISAILLGAMRSAIRTKKLVIEITDEEAYLQFSHSELFRILEYKSWVITYQRGNSSFEEIINVINKAFKGGSKEVETAFSIISRVINNSINDDIVVSLLLNWMRESIKTSISPESSFHIISTFYRLITFGKPEFLNKRINDFKYIFPKLLPIDAIYMGLWKKVEELLCSLANVNEVYFNDFLNIIIQTSSASLKELLENDLFHVFTHGKPKLWINSIFTRLIFSTNDNDRLIAFELFKKSPGISLEGLSETPSDTILKNILLEFSRSIFLAKGTSKFLLIIEPFYNEVNEKLKKDFISEMVFQAINYPGECLNNWESKENKSEVLTPVISKARNYFSKINEVSDLPCNNFSCFEFVEGAKLERKIQARAINSKVKEKSVFMNFVKHTQILYGDEWSFQNSGGGNKPTKFNELHYSVEYPRLESIDPEGMVLKRLIINSNLNK
jgi:hypothetical protein